MANGDPIKNSGVNNWSKIKNRRVEKYLLIDAATAVTDGVWVNVAGALRAGAFIIASNVTAGFTVQFHGYASPTGAAPSNSDDHAQLNTDAVITADGTTDVQLLAGGDTVEYLKASVSARTDGTATVVVVVVY